MDEKQIKRSLGMELLHRFTTNFTPTVLVITLVGMVLARYVPAEQYGSTLFDFEAGLSYSSILQLTGFSVISTFFSILFFSERFITNIRFMYRSFFFFLVLMLTISVFSIVFKWLPLDDILAWVGFLLSFVICYAVSVGLMLFLLKMERKRYSRLLADYKEKH